MIKIEINSNIKNIYLQSLKKILLTPKTKKFTANAKRFFTFLKSDLSLNNKEIYNLLITDNIHSYIKKYGVIKTDEKNYKIYDDLRKIWAIKLVENTISVCPYCNRNYISNIKYNKSTAELDHFFPKTDYPYLAISLYNLIPVCHICNHQKNNKKLKIYPYKDSFHNYVKFNYKISEIPIKKNNVKIIFNKLKNNKKYRKKINNYNNVLNIENIYQNHTDIVLELIKKREIYSDSYIDELTTQYPNMFNNNEDVLRLITCGYVDDKDLHKRPLSKLIKDISEQLELL